MTYYLAVTVLLHWPPGCCVWGDTGLGAASRVSLWSSGLRLSRGSSPELGAVLLVTIVVSYGAGHLLSLGLELWWSSARPVIQEGVSV